MSFESGTNYTESDADDEYDGHIAGSSPVAGSEASPYDSEMPSSSEHTPTTYGHRSNSDRLPETLITDWTADDCATFLSTIGLHKYANAFIGTTNHFVPYATLCYTMLCSLCRPWMPLSFDD